MSEIQKQAVIKKIREKYDAFLAEHPFGVDDTVQVAKLVDQIEEVAEADKQKAIAEKEAEIKSAVKKAVTERLKRLKSPRAGSIFTQAEEIAQEWILRDLLGESMEQTEDVPKRLDDIRRFGGVAFKDWDKMKQKNKKLEAQIADIHNCLIADSVLAKAHGQMDRGKYIDEFLKQFFCEDEGQKQKKCFGKEYPECVSENCSDEESCKLAYQEEIAIPKLEKEMTKDEQKQDFGNYGLELAIGEKIKEQKQKKEAEK